MDKDSRQAVGITIPGKRPSSLNLPAHALTDREWKAFGEMLNVQGITRGQFVAIMVKAYITRQIEIRVTSRIANVIAYRPRAHFNHTGLSERDAPGIRRDVGEVLDQALPGGITGLGQ